MTSRRLFLGLAAASGWAAAQTPSTAVLSEAEPQAQALGYVADARRVDRQRFPNYAPGQRCAACQFYQAPSLVLAPCALFQGKQVAGPGWCSGYVTRPA